MFFESKGFKVVSPIDVLPSLLVGDGPLGAMQRPNGTPVDPAVVADASGKMAAAAAKIADAFLVDTRGFTATKTAALDGIWASYPDFKAKADEMVTALKAAADAGKTGNVDATRTAMQGIGRFRGDDRQRLAEEDCFVLDEQ